MNWPKINKSELVQVGVLIFTIVSLIFINYIAPLYRD